MERTQIYLTTEEARALDQRAKESGRSKSQLIREAIDVTYLRANKDRKSVLRDIRAAAGAWKGPRESGAEQVDRMRPGRPSRLDRTRAK